LPKSGGPFAWAPQATGWSGRARGTGPFELPPRLRQKGGRKKKLTNLNLRGKEGPDLPKE